MFGQDKFGPNQQEGRRRYISFNTTCFFPRLDEKNLPDHIALLQLRKYITEVDN